MKRNQKLRKLEVKDEIGNIVGSYELDQTLNQIKIKFTNRNLEFSLTDEQFDKSQAFSSDSQLYKQAGNSIVVDVLYYIFEKLFEVDTETRKETEC